MKKVKSIENSLIGSNRIAIKLFTIVIFSLFIVAAPFYTNAQVKPDKKEAALKSAQTGLDKAQANLAKVEKQMAIADSLIEAGTTMLNESKSELKQLEADKKKIEKDYASQKKPLDKRITSKDKEDALAAKGELKTLDTQYKADLKDVNTKIIAENKKNVTGTGNINKGKASKKSGEAALKTAKNNVKIAQDKFDKLNEQ